MAIHNIYIKTAYGYVSGLVIDRIATLIYLHIYEEHRNKGHGTELLKLFMIEAFENNAIHIELDDCSDNYRKYNNIYTKYGFTYIGSDNHMHGNIRNIIHNISLFN